MMAITTGEAPWRELNGMLQRGVWCRASTPAPLGAFLTEQLGLGEAYVRSRIETIFLDGLVVDELDRAIVHDGSTVTLSAAMPGLVGATLRRGGYYRAMRREISWSASSHDDPTTGPPTGLVRVKLFNLVLREAGPQLLRRGVLVDRLAATEAFGRAVVEALPDVDGRVLITVDDGTPPEASECT